MTFQRTTDYMTLQYSTYTWLVQDPVKRLEITMHAIAGWVLHRKEKFLGALFHSTASWLPKHAASRHTSIQSCKRCESVWERRHTTWRDTVELAWVMDERSRSPSLHARNRISALGVCIALTLGQQRNVAPRSNAALGLTSLTQCTLKSKF